MSLKILISRNMSNNQVKAALPYLSALTSLAKKQSGYISGEMYTKYDDPEEHLIICTWKSIGDWEKYNNLEESQSLHFFIDQILVKPTEHKIFCGP